MINLNKPEFEERDDKVILSVNFEIEAVKKKLWYSFSNKYKDYLIVEQLDAFVVGLLFLGLKTGHDLKLNAPISARLFYSLNHYLIASGSE